MIPQTDAENENEEAEQLIIHELDQISSPSVLVIYEAKENEADNSGQLTSPSQPQTPITTQTMEKNDQQLASVNTLHTPSPRFTRFLRREEEPDSRRSTPTMVDCEENADDFNDAEGPNEHAESQPDVVPVVEPGTQNDRSVTVTRQEVLALSNMLERIPRDFFNVEGGPTSSRLSLNVIADPPISPVRDAPTTSQEDTRETTQEGSGTQSEGENQIDSRRKRRRPRYSLTTAMLRKHPVLQFFATGPQNKERDPHRWWCRVCRVELSLKTRGALELLSHYRTDTHLTKEHRIRLEIPGMTLYDKQERALLGLELQEAKRAARVAHPIVPQLDGCRLLVGQERLPDLTSNSSPSEDVLAQIGLLEHGLRHGGHVSILIGIWEDMVKLSPNNSQSSIYNWSNHRLFVSIIPFPSSFFYFFDS